MTIVIACQFLTGVGIFADCRVSYRYGDRLLSPDDNLQKIYQIDQRVVLGFSGPLLGADQVIEAIRKNLGKYQKQPVASNLQRDLERWIRHEYRQVTPQNRTNLSFILASVEPGRERRSKWRSSDGTEKSKPNWFPYVPELHVVALKPSQKRPQELVKQKTGVCKIIGVQKTRIQNSIREVVSKFYGFAHKYPQWSPRVLADTFMYSLMQSKIYSVGGLFQIAFLNREGIKWLSYSSPSDQGHVTLEIQDGHYVQIDHTNERVVPLLSVKEHLRWENTRQGSVGAFEDPGLRKAAENANKL